MEILLQNENVHLLQPKDDIEQKLQDEKLLQPFTYIARFTDNTIRSKLVRAFNYWLNIPAEQVAMIENIVEIRHNTSLLLNDIGDFAALGENIPSAHSVYGIPITINAVNHSICVACQIVTQWNHQQASRIFLEQMLELLRGQGIELHWKYNLACPTEEEYKEMATKSSEYMLIVRLMQLFSANQDDFTKLVSILSLSSKIIDDLENWTAERNLKENSNGGDPIKGKFSFPVIHAIKSRPDDEQIMCMLRQDSNDPKFKKYCVSLLEKFGSLEYTKKKLVELRKEALQEMKTFGSNPHMESAIDYIFKDVV